MPGFVLEQGNTDNLTYTYDAPLLSQDFPNIDLHDTDDRTGVDTITMSFLVSGEDGGGNKVYRARQILRDRLQACTSASAAGRLEEASS